MLVTECNFNVGFKPGGNGETHIDGVTQRQSSPHQVLLHSVLFYLGFYYSSSSTFLCPLNKWGSIFICKIEFPQVYTPSVTPLRVENKTLFLFWLHIGRHLCAVNQAFVFLPSSSLVADNESKAYRLLI